MVAKSKGYDLENKFELLEDFQSYKPAPLFSELDTEMTTFSLVVDGSSYQEEVDSTVTAVMQSSDTKWGPKEYQTSNHPLKLMVRCDQKDLQLCTMLLTTQVDYDRENLLGHPLVKELLSYKWKRVGIPGLIVYFSCYMMFLILLTAFALVIPRPGPRNNFCKNNMTMHTHETKYFIILC